MVVSASVPKISNIRWVFFAIGGFVALALISAWQHSVPAEDWLQVNGVTVSDTPLGRSPLVDLDRVIKQSARALRTIRLELQGEQGHWFTVCQASDARRLEIGDTFPPQTLYALTGKSAAQIDCTPTVPGAYRVRVIWRVMPDAWPDKVVDVRSNVFLVTPAPERLDGVS